MNFGRLRAFLEEAGLSGAIDEYAVCEWVTEVAQSALAKPQGTGERTEAVLFEE